jgi:hypothetical protein
VNSRQRFSKCWDGGERELGEMSTAKDQTVKREKGKKPKTSTVAVKQQQQL